MVEVVDDVVVVDVEVVWVVVLVDVGWVDVEDLSLIHI
mgnify:CR=1 FL=1